MKRALLIAVVCVALAACADHPCTSAPPPMVVDRIVSVACIDKKDIPVEPPRIGDHLSGSALHDFDLVSASAIRLRLELEKAIAVLGACAK